jgi:hypothetical protein
MRATGLPAPSALGTSLTDAGTLDALLVPLGGAGVVLGRTTSGRPATVSLFRPEPTSVVLVGSRPLAQLIAFRSMAVGARVLVSTVDPARWTNVARLAAGSSGDVRLVPRPAGGPGTATVPHLVVADGVLPEDADQASGGPGSWSTTLTVLGQLTDGSRDLLAGADLLLVQSPSSAEARAVAAALARPEAEALLAGLGPEDVGAVTRHGVRTWASTPTSVERWLIGAVYRLPARLDPPRG